MISEYLPFKDERPIVCYFSPEVSDDIGVVQQVYPEALVTPFYNSLGRPVFTRLVIPAANLPTEPAP